MKVPILIAAFGTTTKALTTYDHIDEKIRSHFPDDKIIWTCSSKIIASTLKQQTTGNSVHLDQALQKLTQQGYTRAVVQSLHLFPGIDFHNLCETVRRSPLHCMTGMPLLNRPEDYQAMVQLMQPVIAKHTEKAILIMGHGTNHPTWTGYYALEKILRNQFGKNIYVGVTEKFPDSSHLIDEIAGDGFKEVCIIPFFLVAGMHYQRDIISHNKDSWQSRFENRGFTVHSVDYGLGLYNGIEQIIIRHIEDTKAKF